MSNLQIVNHPFVNDSLASLRDKNCTLENFRKHSAKISTVLISEALKDLATQKIEVETPLKKTKGEKINQDFIIIPIIRAGIAMLDAAFNLIPNAKVGFVGMERDEYTAIASQYYCKVPKINKNSILLIVDPMLATGGSVLQVLEHISLRPKVIKIVSIICAPEGVKKIEDSYPKIQIYTGALDNKLNSKKYIVPGLGDYGDRYFGTV